MRKKGFTLIELIVVIAIIGILAGVLMPSWGAYLRRARTRSQNLKAKAVFSAAQTIVTDMKFAERKDYNNFLEVCSTTSDVAKIKKASDYVYGDFSKNDTGAIEVDSNGHPSPCEFVFYWDGSAVSRVDIDASTGTARKKRIVREWNAKLADSINRIVKTDEIVYKVYVKDYQVMSVVSARSADDRFLGAYPTNLGMLENNGVDIDSIRDGGIDNVNMKDFIIEETS